MDSCDVCNLPSSMRCGRCKVAVFCGKSCAQEGWKRWHRIECNESESGKEGTMATVAPPVDLESLYIRFRDSNSNQELAFKWLLEKRLAPSWTDDTSVSKSWRGFLVSERAVLTKETDALAGQILRIFGLPFENDRSIGDNTAMGDTLRELIVVDPFVTSLENASESGKERKEDTIVDIIDTVVDQVEEGVEVAIDEKVDEIKDLSLELQRKIDSAELTMKAMNDELKRLRALIPEHEAREKFLQEALDACQSKDSKAALPKGPPPPPKAPPPSVVDLPARPMAGATKLLSDVKLKTAEIAPAAKKGAESSENSLLDAINNFTPSRLRKASDRKLKEPPKELSFADQLAKRFKGARGTGQKISSELVLAVIQGKYFRERVRAAIGDRLFV